MNEFRVSGTITFFIMAETEQDAIEEFIEQVIEEVSYSPNAFDDIDVEELDYGYADGEI